VHTTPSPDDDATILAGLLDEAARTGTVTTDMRDCVVQILDGHQRRHRDAIDTQWHTTQAVIAAVEAERDEARERAERVETRPHNAVSTTLPGLRREVPAALAATIHRSHLASADANTVLADLHLPALLRYFDVTATVPVTVRVPALDADDARRTAVALIADDLTGPGNVQVDLGLATGVQVTEDHAEPVSPDEEPVTGAGSQQ